MNTSSEAQWMERQTIALQDNWILKNDSDKIILYVLSNNDSVYFSLTPQAGIILSLFNGMRTIGEIIQRTQFIFSCPREIAQAYVLGLIQALNDQQNYPFVAKHPIFSNEVSKAQPRGDLNPLELVVAPTDSPPSPRRRLNAPISLLIFFTNLCQTDCRYCYAERKPIPKSEWLTLREWRGVLEQAREVQIKKVSLTGGDTFARRDAIGFIELLLEYDMLFLISTKCRVPPEYARRLADAGFCNPVHGVPREFQFSLDSGDPRIAAFLTRRSGFLPWAKASIRNLIEAGIYPRVKAVLTPYNIQGLELLVEEVVPLGVKEINFTFYEPTFYRHSEDLTLSDEEKTLAADILSTFPQKYPEVQFEGNAMSGPEREGSPEEKVGHWKSRAGCSGGRVELGITADGQAVLCEQTPQSAPFVFGDLRKSSILEIWRSEDLLDFIFPPKDKFIGTPCYGCHEFEHCQYVLGNCFRDAFFATGNPFNAPPSCPYREKIPRIGNWRDRQKPVVAI